MITLCLLSCLALTSAAPQLRLNFHYGSPHDDDLFQHGHHSESDEFFGGEVFDTRKFWQELETEMQRFDQMLNDFYKHFPTATAQSGIQGNEYIITQTLTGFDEEDIKVKAKEGVLMIQAVHKNEDGDQQRSYLDLRALPTYVNINGSWTFERGLLKIVFPLNSQPDDVTTVVTQSTVTSTAAPEIDERSREEMDNTNNDHHADADVGLDAGNDKETEIRTNHITRDRQPFEATTYAVDLKNDVEFVPVKY